MTSTLSVASPQDTLTEVVVTLLNTGAGGVDGATWSGPDRVVKVTGAERALSVKPRPG